MPTTNLPRLAEAGSADEAGAARAQAAKAAREALGQVLREHVELVRDLDGEIARLVEQALARITAQLAAAPSDYQQWVLPRLMEGLRRVLDELAAGAGTKAGEGVRQAWDLGTRLVDAPLAADAAVQPAPPVLAVPAVEPAAGLGVPQLRQMRAMQAFTTAMINGATADTVNAINRALGQVILGASTPFDAIKAVAQLLPDRTRAQLRGIVNSNLAAAFNSAAFQRLREQAARDPNLRKQWRRSGKLHSRDNHDAADGQVREVDKPFELLTKKGQPVQIMFPADPAAPLGETIHCGCVALPWKAGWKMRTAGPKPLTAAEKAAKAARAPRSAAPRKAAPATTTQERILRAFAAATPGWRDVTGQRLVVDERLFPAATGDARLVKAGRDLYSYNAVQTLKRPTEVWQTERVDASTGELLRERIFLKRFTGAGQQWLGRAVFRLDGGTWVPTGAYTAQAVGQGIETAFTAARAGARVYPPRR